MTIKTLDAFRASFGAKPVEVTLKQFGKDAAFYLKPLSSADRDAFEASVAGIDGERDLHNLRARLVALSLCDEEGHALGTADEIGQLRADVVGALFDEVRHLNGMDAEDIEEAGKD